MNKKSNKTASVMKLLTNGPEAGVANPILNEEFKDERIHSRGVQPKNEQPVSGIAEPQKAVRINIISELVAENQQEVAERFRCCTCDICMAELTVSVLNELSPKYAYVRNGSYDEVESLKEKHKKEVMCVLVKHAIKLKNNPAHT
jgi:hypothetical protein